MMWCTLDGNGVFWSIFGVILFFAELFLGASFMLFIFGVAAIIVSVMVFFGVIQGIVAQLSLFAFLFLIIGFIFWKNIKRSLLNGGMTYNNIIGSSAKVIDGGIEPGKIGRIKWSGTVCFASSDSFIADGSDVVIVKNLNNVFIVKERG